MARKLFDDNSHVVTNERASTASATMLQFTSKVLDSGIQMESLPIAELHDCEDDDTFENAID